MMGFFPRALFPALCCLPLLAHAGGAVLTGSLGFTSRDHFRPGGFGYSLAAYAKFDEQTLIGVQSGQGTVAGAAVVPIVASALVRLPLGRIILPVAAGDIGYALGGGGSGFLWRGGGGFDIRNGRRSSFLLLGAYEQQGSRVGWMGRFGLLLEI